jgi:putative membrane protein
MNTWKGAEPMGRRSNRIPKNQLLYTQQHLANERTYLAWIRTGISIVGVGFLATSLHFTMGVIRNQFVDVFTISLGIFSCIFGLTIIFSATQNYKKKRRQIINETFYPSNLHITLISSMLAVMIIMVIIYFFMIM